MVYLLLLVGLVFFVAIGAFLWGRLDPEVKAANAEYEKSLANSKNEDDTTVSLNNESNVEHPNTENVLYRKDVSGLMLYFKKMNNMERLFSELTNAIRNGSSVIQYLVDANIMKDQNTMRIVATGFTDISSFLKGMLEIKENDELRKDYNACLEVINILDKSEKKFKEELNSFDSKGLSERYNIEEKNLEIIYSILFLAHERK